MSILGQPITIFKGEDRTFTGLVVDQDDERVDITGFGIEFEVKPNAGDPDPAIIAKSVGSGITIDVDQVTNKGEFTLELDPADTSPVGVIARVYKYDLVIIDGSSERQVAIPPTDFDLRAVVNIAP